MAINIGPDQLAFQNTFSSSSYSRGNSKESMSGSSTHTPQEQQSESLHGFSPTDIIHLDSLGVNKSPTVNILEEDISFHKTINGRRTSLLMSDPELTSRIDNLLSRLSAEQGLDLIDLGLLHDESNIEYLEQLSDKDLKNLVRTGAALETKGTDRDRYYGNTGEIEFKSLIENLQKMDEKTASKVLEKTSQLSMPVPLKLREKLTVYPPGGIPPEIKGHSSANDLHLIVRTLGNLDSENVNATTNAIFDNLSKFSDDQQSNLLMILENKPELGLRLMEQLSEFGKEVQDLALNYMSDLIKSISPYASSAPATAPNDSLGPDEWHGAVLNYDANAESVNQEMMNQFVSMLENYVFSNDQLSKMASDLGSMDNLNQRFYLDITTIGLKSLLGSDNSQPINLENNQEALDVIDKLRSSDIVRTLISESRMGEKRNSENGRSYYAVKGEAPGKLDQKQTIEVLVTDAWFNRQEPGRVTSLATKLSTLEADQRDELVDELQLINKTDKPLSNYGIENKDQEFEAFFKRTDVIHESNDLKALLNAKDKLEDGHQDNFWQAANFLGNDVNTIIDLINQLPNSDAELLVAYISNLSEQVNQEGLEEEDALRQASEAVDAFDELNTVRQKNKEEGVE